MVVRTYSTSQYDVVSDFCPGEMEEKMKIMIGQVHCDLEGRDTYARTQETNLGKDNLLIP